MGKLIKNLFFQTPFILGLVFIMLTAGRVKSFAGNDFRALVFAIGLTTSIYVCAFLLGWKTTRWASFFALLFFVIMDGFFNLAETLRWSVEIGRWDQSISFSPDFSVYMYRFTDVPYGVFPTVAVILLGWVAQRSEKVAGNVGEASFKSLLARIGLATSDGEPTQSDKEATIKRYECDLCEFETTNRYEYSGHCRTHKNGKEPIKEVAT